MGRGGGGEIGGGVGRVFETIRLLCILIYIELAECKTERVKASL